MTTRRKAEKKPTEVTPALVEGDEELESPNTELKGLGSKSLALLAEVGLKSRDDIEAVGPAEAFRRVRELHPDRVNNTLLWQLVGALLDLDWRELPADMKQHMLFEVEAKVQKAAKAAQPPSPPK